MKNIYTHKNYKTISIILIAFFAVLYSLEIRAQVRVPFTQRASLETPDRLIYNIKGDFQMIGNSNLTLQSYSDDGNNSNNMIYVDIDGDPNTINSSSATLQLSTENGALPQCSNIIYAGLYWTGRAHDGTSPNAFPVGGINRTLQHSNTVTGSNPAYNMTITRRGTNNNFYVRYTFAPTSGTGSIYHFDFTNNADNSANVVTVTIGNGAPTNIPSSVTTSFWTNDRTATFNTPYIIGNFVVTELLRDKRDSRSENQYRSYPCTASVAVGIKMLDKHKVKFKYIGQNYINITASDEDIYYPTNGDGYMYSAYADVTQYVRQFGIGEYFVADMALREGAGGNTGYFGGWGLIVVYENSKMKWRDVTIFDGHAYVEGSTTVSHELPVSGFHTAQNGDVNMKLGIIAGEGDRSITGDYFQIQRLNTNQWVDLSHGNNATNNFFNSSVYPAFPRDLNRLNNLGLDVSMFDIPNAGNTIIANNQTSTKFRYGSTQDTYIICCIAMAVDAYVPDPEALNSIIEVNGVGFDPNVPLLPGQEVTYTIEVRNHGTEAINNLAISIPVSYNTTFVSATAEYFGIPNGTVSHEVGAGGGVINWNVGNIPLPATGTDPLYARLTYKLKVTTNCFILSNPVCGNNVAVGGASSGTGATSGYNFANRPLVTGYSTSGECVGEPITTPLNTPINTTAYVTSNCNGGTGYEVQNFDYCNITTPNIPFNMVSPNFPVGSRFYSAVVLNSETGQMEPAPGATQYTPATGFPKTVGQSTYYAIPPGLNNGCSFEFIINVTQITTIPTTPNGGVVSYCQGSTAVPLTATPTNSAYTLYYYTTATGGSPQLSITPSTATVGSVDYWVAEGSSPQCISPNRAKITVTVNAIPVCDISGSTADVCPGASLNFTAPAGMDGYLWTVSGNAAISGIANGAAVTVVAGASCNQSFTLSLQVTKTACQSTCQKTVNVVDNTKPTITCVSNQERSIAGEGVTSYKAKNNEFDATYSDNCNGALYVSYSLTGATTATNVVASTLAGQTFGIGTTTVTWKVKDNCNNEITCTFTVKVTSITFKYTVSDVDCYASSTGQIVITAIDGVAPFIFSKDNGATWDIADAGNNRQKTYTGLSANSYQILVRDALGTVSDVCSGN